MISYWSRSDPTEDVLWAVEQIMTDILGESEEISLGLLSPLLASVLKENKVIVLVLSAISVVSVCFSF